MGALLQARGSVSAVALVLIGAVAGAALAADGGRASAPPPAALLRDLAAALESVEERPEEGLVQLGQILNELPSGEPAPAWVRDATARVHLGRNLALVALQRWEEALAATEAALVAGPADPDVLALAFLYRASDLATLGRYDEAYRDAVAAANSAESGELAARARVLAIRLGGFLFLP